MSSLDFGRLFEGSFLNAVQKVHIWIGMTSLENATTFRTFGLIYLRQALNVQGDWQEGCDVKPQPQPNNPNPD